MLPANDNFQFFSFDELRLFRAQDEAKEAAWDGRAFLAKWLLKLTNEGVTTANKRNVNAAAEQLSSKARAWVRCNLPAAWRR